MSADSDDDEHVPAKEFLIAIYAENTILHTEAKPPYASFDYDACSILSMCIRRNTEGAKISICVCSASTNEAYTLDTLKSDLYNAEFAKYIASYVKNVDKEAFPAVALEFAKRGMNAKLIVVCPLDVAVYRRDIEHNYVKIPDGIICPKDIPTFDMAFRSALPVFRCIERNPENGEENKRQLKDIHSNLITMCIFLEQLEVIGKDKMKAKDAMAIIEDRDAYLSMETELDKALAFHAERYEKFGAFLVDRIRVNRERINKKFALGKEINKQG